MLATRAAAAPPADGSGDGTCLGCVRMGACRLTSELERKVAALKMASQAIHDEVTDQNRLLNGMVSEAGQPPGGRRDRNPASLRALLPRIHAPPPVHR